jgi:ketopantoate reductase
MKHAVLGPGAIGGLVATALAHETAQVTLLVRPHAHTDHSGMLHLQRPHDAIEAQVEIAARLQSLPPAMRSSMQKDVSAGRDPELDAVGGAIIRAGRKYGIGVPAIRKLVVEIQERLRRQRRPRQSAVSG